MTLALATWNVNSLKVRLPHLLRWLAQRQLDIVCLQETKLPDDRFPVPELQAAGYRSVFAGQKTYNGVAILSRLPTEPADIQVNLPNFPDEQRRLLAASFDGLRVVCAYVPNGQSVDSDKYAYKLKWLEALAHWLRGELARHDQLALAGDFNIAPEARDVHDPVRWDGQVLFSEPERAAFRALLDLGLKDAFRLFEQPERSYTWWDYRNLAFRRQWGLRIDHILLSPSLAAQCSACTIDVALRGCEQPSDHAPVIATLSL
ncbi:MAG: exodeoxyribonuclease III [Sutterellaceae bacterium]|nr:exodeoxyribonuclease III [Burkholderiaceae bacterium]MDW8430469.1 exodeoxyribonuclease III [Sutterellaceae bacterium]